MGTSCDSDESKRSGVKINDISLRSYGSGTDADARFEPSENSSIRFDDSIEMQWPSTLGSNRMPNFVAGYET